MIRLLSALLVAAFLVAALALFASAMPVQDQGTFAFVDVYVDSGTTPLAAWQVELVDAGDQARIVGIEGGEHPAFRAAPYYDPRALQQGRVVIAAFQTDSALPSGSSRVARIHFVVSGAGAARWSAKLVTAADADGHTIPATITLSH
jgi:hypothetical protein